MPGLDLILGGRQTTTLGPDMTGLGLSSGAGGLPANALFSRVNNQPLISRSTGAVLIARSK